MITAAIRRRLDKPDRCLRVVFHESRAVDSRFGVGNGYEPAWLANGAAQNVASTRAFSLRRLVEESAAGRGQVEFHFGELFPRVGFIVTNLAASNRAVVREEATGQEATVLDGKTFLIYLRRPDGI